MRRAYISPHIDLPESFQLARQWAGDNVTIIGSGTSLIEALPSLEKSGLPIGTTSNKRSRFTAKARSGTVIAWLLNLGEILDIERNSGLDGLVAVRGYGQHAPWITVHEPELLGGEPVPRISEASAPIKAMVAGISMVAIVNQGLIDSRDRSTAIHALTYFRDHGHPLISEQLIVEAIRQGWPGASPLEMADLAKQLNEGRRLRHDKGLNPSVLVEWAAAT